MKNNLKDKVAIVIDYGGAMSAARMLGGVFKKVYYNNPSWKSSFVRWQEYLIGEGVDEIERIDDFWPVFNEIDIWIFPDLFQGEFQIWLQEQGKRVVGARDAEELEIYRGSFKQALKKLKLESGDFAEVQGIEELRKYLKGKSDLWIKASLVRQNMETWHYLDDKLSAGRLRELEYSLGAFGSECDFLVESPVDGVEAGFDGILCAGESLPTCMTGIEIKDAGYLGKAVPYKKLPIQLLDVNEAFAKVFKKSNYSGYMSTEVRIREDGSFIFSDLCARFGSPPGDAMNLVFTNMAQVLWDISEGIPTDLEFDDPYVVQVIMKSNWAVDEPQPIFFPEKYKKNVNIKNLAIIDDVHYYIPVIGMSEFGSVCATGRTAEEAIDEAKKICDTIKGDSIELNIQPLYESGKEIEKLKSFGIKLF